tara:strand:+ start:1093 stop:1722 length:630 start_codon:yes stop_codon:yes gene_type:complete
MVLTFLGLEVTPEATFALRRFPKLDSIEQLLAALQRHIAGAPTTPESFRELQRACSLDSQTAGGLFSGTLWLLRTAMRSALQPKALAVEFADIKVPAHFVPPLVAAVTEGRAALAAEQQDESLGLPSLQELRWRLDVSISTSSLHRVLRPHLTLQTDLSDGTSHCFYASKERFDELRYTVARLINDMQGAEARLPPLVEAAVDRRGSVQ